MKMLIMISLLFGMSAFGDASRDVFIRGKVSNEFDEKQVKVVDSYGQVYFLARKLFPKDFKFKQGQQFVFEVKEKELDRVKILNK
jgi:hypothetical protein